MFFKTLNKNRNLLGIVLKTVRFIKDAYYLGSLKLMLYNSGLLDIILSACKVDHVYPTWDF
ncbi:MAG: hypothetical protein CM15mP65_00470 [Crocinitomicaceae bacterium]|nr:MAG: hypothetical protein CM15mP65_00470 [Crocinitomicaceae bacterium]